MTRCLFQGFLGSLRSIPTVLVTLLVGPLSDRFSRKPVILVSLGGYFLLNIVYIVNVYWFNELKVRQSKF